MSPRLKLFSIINYLNYYKLIKGFSLETKQCVYSSDSTPFADSGVPAITFARLSNENGAQIHSRNDVIERLSKNNYYATCQFIIDLLDGWINGVKFPIAKDMPDNMKLEIDYYFSRKKRPNQ